jgi:hypothetical protein
MPTVWLCLIVGGVSYVGGQPYRDELSCRADGARVAIGVKYNCLPIYMGEGEAPGFRCEDRIVGPCEFGGGV